MNRILSGIMIISSLTVAGVITPCHATFQYMWLVNYECNPAGLEPGHRVWRVYGQFDNPGDRVVGVFGSTSSPATINASAGFFQHSFGGHTAPEVEAVQKFPAVQWDTFVTIGVSQDDGTDQTGLSPSFPQLPVVQNTNISWVVPPAGWNQGAPDYSRKVLLMQLTLKPGSGISSVLVNLTYRPAGSTTNLTLTNVGPVLLPLSAGDANHSLSVNIDDLLLIINNWGATGLGIPDPSDNGIVDMDDLLLVLHQWGFFTGTCE